ncbi:MAG: sugar phosphate isomerase/epimerase [Chloroflexi bacterium]|nr:sugar phosphate isomerase/epimerase [Chloroflexota bacterium]
MDEVFELSGFGDEIAEEPDDQLAQLGRMGIRNLDLRSAWGRNVLDLTVDDVARLRASLAAQGARVSLIGSPIGKSEIGREAAFEAERLERALRMAEAFGTRSIRVFSFYPAGVDPGGCREEVLTRLERLTARAAREGVTLLLENEADLWADRPERCRELLEAIDSPNLRMTLDTGNFAALGVRSVDEAYPLLRPYLVHVQIKDVRRRDGEVTTTVPGEGDGQIRELLAALRRDGYRGFLALEPHLAHAGKLGGFSGPELFGQAARALQAMISDSAP